MLLEEALSKFLMQLQADGRSEHTRKQYGRHVRALGSWLGRERGGQDLRLVGHEDVAGFLASPAARLRPDGVSKKATSVNALRSSLRCFFGYLHAAGYLATNPARLVRRARCGPPPPRALSEAEQERLMGVLEAAEGPEAERDRVLFGLMLYAGLRLGSALALRVEDVDLKRGELRVWRAKYDQPGTVVLGRAARALLRQYLSKKVTGQLFTANSGRQVSGRHMQRKFQRWAKEAGLPTRSTTHSLRHSFALRLLEQTGDIDLVRMALGHHSITSTMVYAQTSPQRLRCALEKSRGNQMENLSTRAEDPSRAMFFFRGTLVPGDS